MQRLRRTRQRQELVPVAAEVLELRALLSSATAAVQGATHHAAVQQAANPAVHIAPQAAFHGLVQSSVSIAGAPPQLLPFTFSIGNVHVVLGAHVSARFSFSVTSGGNKVSLKGSLVGTIAAFGPIPGGKTLVTITPTGGSMVYSEKVPGHPLFKATAIPNGSPILLELTTATNAFERIGATDVFRPTAPGGLAGQPLVILIGL